MAKTTYTASHLGFDFTRTTARTYTHVVVVAESLKADRARVEAGARHSWKTNRDYRQALAECRNPLAVKYPESYPPERVAIDAADAKAWLADGEAGVIARALASFDAYTADRQLLADGDTYFSVAGWCGRPDLAQKLAAKFGPLAVALPVSAKS